jgi:hypothetical protein
MVGAFDDETDQGAFQRDPTTLPNPFPDRFSDAEWRLALQRCSDLARFASPQDIPFGAPGPITTGMGPNPFWQGLTGLPFAQLAAATNAQDQLALQQAGATNSLDLWGIGGNPNAASNPLDPSGIGSRVEATAGSRIPAMSIHGSSTRTTNPQRPHPSSWRSSSRRDRSSLRQAKQLQRKSRSWKTI